MISWNVLWNYNKACVQQRKPFCFLWHTLAGFIRALLIVSCHIFFLVSCVVIISLSVWICISSTLLKHCHFLAFALPYIFIGKFVLFDAPLQTRPRSLTVKTKTEPYNPTKTKKPCALSYCFSTCWHWNGNSAGGSQTVWAWKQCIKAACLERLWTLNCALTSSLKPCWLEDYWKDSSEPFRSHLKKKSPCFFLCAVTFLRPPLPPASGQARGGDKERGPRFN